MRCTNIILVCIEPFNGRIKTLEYTNTRQGKCIASVILDKQ